MAYQLNPTKLRISVACKIIDWISLAPWLFLFLKKHRTIRSVVLMATFVSFMIATAFGVATLLMLGAYAAQMAFAAVFMIAQFAFLFLFLSNTKSIEVMPGEKGKVTFDRDYFGNEAEVELVKQWTSLLTGGRDKLDHMGAKAISGMILEGPPGTGKTLMAKCLASESGAAFYGLNGSDFQAMFFGVGPMKVMRTAAKGRGGAKEYGAAIIFIDEIDAIGGKRGGVSGDPRQGPVAGGMAGGMFGGMGGLGVLSRLFTEMDGMIDNPLNMRDEIQNKIRAWFELPLIEPGVVLWMAATNRFGALDTALVRPGRFDKKIQIGLPDLKSREQLIEGYLNKVKHDGKVNVDVLAKDCAGVSQAFLATAIQKDAARIAIFDGRDHITQRDIEFAVQESVLGIANPIRNMNEEQRRQVAVHEAGHAVMAWMVRPRKRLARASIVRRSGGILGYVRDVEKEEIYTRPLEDYHADIMVSLAGDEATKVVFGRPWTGASGDNRHIQQLMYVLAMYGQFGEMLPFVAEDPFASSAIREAADMYLKSARARVHEMLKDNRNLLDDMTNALLDHDELNSEEIYAVLGEPDDSGVEAVAVDNSIC